MDSAFDEAHAKLMEALKESRRRALGSDAPQTMHYAREALVSVWPVLPGMIDHAVGQADARIFSKEELRTFLAEFAVDVMLGQADAIDRWIASRARAREKMLKTGA